MRPIALLFEVTVAISRKVGKTRKHTARSGPAAITLLGSCIETETTGKSHIRLALAAGMPFALCCTKFPCCFSYQEHAVTSNNRAMGRKTL